jgi:hypothetical protein
MKTVLNISIGLNLVLLGALLLHFSRSSRQNRSTPALMSSTDREPKAVEVVSSAPQTLPTVSWAQLESSDYPNYIKNLRAIGCPEQTIRDIITADVGNLYKHRRQPLERKLKWSESAAIAPDALRALAKNLQELSNEEASVLHTLLGGEPPALASDGHLPTRPSPTRANELSISKPLVLQNVDPATLNLNPAQLEAINDLRQQFVNEIGGPNQDPNDPGYKERWQRIQPQIDLMLRGVIGTQAYQDYQVAGWSEPSSGNKDLDP